MAENFYRISKGINLSPQAGPGDPPGANGDIYYNQALGKFRKYQNGFWTDLDTSGGGGGSSGWIAQEANLIAGSTSLAVGFASTQPDTSYVVYAMMTNTVDLLPQYQQVVISGKTPSGFTASWNAPTDSANYKLSFIVPLKAFMMAEASIGNAQTSVTTSFPIPQNGTNYGLIAAMQNIVDPVVQFQTIVITSIGASNFTASWPAPTDSANYKLSYMVNATSIVSIGSGQTSVVAPLPVDYGTSAYSVIALMLNTVDPTPQWQPLLVTAKANDNFTVSWSDPTDSANYKLVYYAISYSS